MRKKLLLKGIKISSGSGRYVKEKACIFKILVFESWFKKVCKNKFRGNKLKILLQQKVYKTVINVFKQKKPCSHFVVNFFLVSLIIKIMRKRIPMLLLSICNPPNTTKFIKLHKHRKKKKRKTSFTSDTHTKKKTRKQSKTDFKLKKEALLLLNKQERDQTRSDQIQNQTTKQKGIQITQKKKIRVKKKNYFNVTKKNRNWNTIDDQNIFFFWTNLTKLDIFGMCHGLIFLPKN
ncbi:hypothetical protein RFI_15541 [Reticulomyxa filosa]|uniref:Uncharacterized protein n=1 Tax=Reticulomyxa filosa TaxID=46433 RepID=X6N6V7_RETFI|nr:hypothetical protein RFI_15541 [Reticulomyxa filosa]|eukprot:ETO21663.1 hypothetical protein RFI_15541 [Reticulomyxa filosa]